MQTSPLEAFKTLVECHCRESRKQEGKQRLLPFITLSRQCGAGGTSVARKLEELLNLEKGSAVCPWHVFDKDLAKVVLEEHHLPREMADYMEENKVSEIKDMIEEMAGMHPPHFTLVRQTSETIAHLARFGHAVIVGRGGNIVTRKLAGGLHVRLIGSQEKRIKHVENFFKLSTAEAAKKVQGDDKARQDYLKQNFGRDVNEPGQYDLVINTDGISYEAAAKIIIEALHLKYPG